MSKDSFTNINSAFTPDANYWELNPQHIIIPEFNKVYKIDDGGVESSKIMWCNFFLNEPDEEDNKLFRLGPDKIKETISEIYYPDVNWDDDIWEEIGNAYKEYCMSSVKKSLYMKKESLRRRAVFLNTVEYDEDNISKIDTAHSKTPKIIEDFEKIEERFFKNKTSAQVKGGRKQSKSETKEI